MLSGMLSSPKFTYHGILQRNYRKMTIKWSFSYNSLVKMGKNGHFPINP